jgi:hypothetical protein
MTDRQMQKEFEQSAGYVDLITRFPNKRLISEDVNYYLNESQTVYVNKRLNAIKRNIRDSQRELDELRPLFVKGTELPKDNELTTINYHVGTLPVNYLYLISDYTAVKYCGSTKKVQNRLYSSEKIQEIRNTYHTQPHHDSPVSELINNKLYVYVDNDLTFSINSVNIDYIKTFTEIDVLSAETNCELDQSVHKDIVQGAVNIFIESSDPQRFRGNTEKNILTEQIK